MNGAPLATVALGGVAALDATPVAQTLLSQPLVTATLLGWMWGNMTLALEVGIVLQILAASTLPIGARTPEDYAVGGVAGTGLALLLAHREPFAMAQEACAWVGVVAGAVAAVAGVPLIKWQRRTHEGLARWCESEIVAGRAGALATAHGAALLLAFGAGLALTALVLVAGNWAIAPAISGHSIKLARAWSLSQPLWLGVGLAQLAQAFIQRRIAHVAAFGAALLGAWVGFVARAG